MLIINTTRFIRHSLCKSSPEQERMYYCTVWHISSPIRSANVPDNIVEG